MRDRKPVTILVVDDNPATRYTTGRFLSAAGFQIIEAATGEEGVERSRAADVVILDVNLPDIHGFEVCRRIRAREESRRLPVIHLSATFVADRDKVHGLESGADGYLTHPVEPPVLVATVNAFLRARDAEEATRRSEEKFRAIFDHAMNGISLLSQDLIFLEVNPALCKILGRRREELVGRHNSAFVPQGYEEEVAAISRSLEKGMGWRGTLPLIRGDGGIVDLEWSVSIHSSPGVRLAIINDVTERKSHEAERERLLASERAARAEAERASLLKDDFLATLSHELRTPLNAIVGWAQMLARDGANDAELTAEGIEVIARNARVQAQLIDDLLDMSRIISGKVALKVTRASVEEVVRAAVASVRHAADAKQVSLVLELAADMRDITADGNRIQQVLWNLLSNAIKFTPRLGTVTVSSRQVNSQVEIAVTDTGEGIKPEFLPYVFDRFRQADATTTRRHGGLGIGLAISKNLVELHGGMIEATSAGSGRGAMFRVTLPVSAAHNVPDADDLPGRDDLQFATSGSTLPSLAGVRLLVVDDEADARQLLKKVFHDRQAVVTPAVSATDALDLLRSQQFDGILSDIGMPNADGYWLMRKVRELPADAGGKTPAVALTAFARPEDAERAIQAGFQVHVAKPVNPSELIAIVAKLLGR